MSLTACATSGPSLEDPGPMAAGWRLPSELVDGYTGSSVDGPTLWSNLQRVPVVYVAEQHDAARDHAVQLAVVAAMQTRVGDVALGMEMFLRSQQPALDAWVAGELTEAEFRAAVDWPTTWGFDYSLYRPLLEYAREHRIPIYGLNVEREVSRALARQGLAGLPEDLRARLPEMDLSDAEHRAWVRKAMGFGREAGGGAHHGELSFERLYQAQVLWDEYMAESIAQALAAEQGPRQMIVLAGRGHVERRFGIPERAARRGAEPYRTVIPVYDADLEDLRALVENGAGDFIWLMAEDPDGLPHRQTLDWGLAR
ncbi:MAG TPA: ChaN family lipoprotein [Myxococcales bacterium LLY-WYZ-16_1]|nr:ChaN family lipoprotein [Myxococcales bacterium LLY-WYZ-16_1]